MSSLLKAEPRHLISPSYLFGHIWDLLLYSTLLIGFFATSPHLQVQHQRSPTDVFPMLKNSRKVTYTYLIYLNVYIKQATFLLVHFGIQDCTPSFFHNSMTYFWLIQLLE